MVSIITSANSKQITWSSMLHLKWLTAQISENQVYEKYIFWRHIMEFGPLYLWIISVKVYVELRDLSCGCG